MQTGETLSDRDASHEASLSFQDDAATTRGSAQPSASPLFLGSCAGTIAAGALFGLLTGGIAGLIVGGILASVIGIAIHLTFAAIVHLLWLTQFALPFATLAGALTGIASTAIVWDESLLGLEFSGAVTLAAMLGGAGGALGAAAVARRRREPPKEHSLMLRIRTSPLEAVARLALAVGLAAGWYWVTTSIHDARVRARTPITVAELRTRFDEHSNDFDLIVTMLAEDEAFRAIYSDGSFDDEVIGQERGAEYLDLLERTGLAGSYVNSSHNAGNHRIEILPPKQFRDGLSKTYLYTEAEPKRIVADFDEADAEAIRLSDAVHVRLGHNWYVAIERPDYGSD
jgi:hypothetical protein